VTDDAGDFRIHQLLRHGIADLGVFLIVLCQQFEHGFPAAILIFAALASPPRAAPRLVVLAEVSDSPVSGATLPIAIVRVAGACAFLSRRSR